MDAPLSDEPFELIEIEPDLGDRVLSFRHRRLPEVEVILNCRYPSPDLSPARGSDARRIELLHGFCSDCR